MTAKSVPAGDGWLHEPKLDGYRLQVAKDGPTVRLYSRPTAARISPSDVAGMGSASG